MTDNKNEKYEGFLERVRAKDPNIINDPMWKTIGRIIKIATAPENIAIQKEFTRCVKKLVNYNRADIAIGCIMVLLDLLKTKPNDIKYNQFMELVAAAFHVHIALKELDNIKNTDYNQN